MTFLSWFMIWSVSIEYKKVDGILAKIIHLSGDFSVDSEF